MEIPSGAMALGIPARIKEGAVAPDFIATAKESYVRRVVRFRDELRRLDA